MSIPVGRLSAAAAFVLLVTSAPATSLAYPISTSPMLTTGDPSPLRSLLSVLGSENASLWAALDAAYSGTYVPSACQPPC